MKLSLTILVSLNLGDFNAIFRNYPIMLIHVSLLKIVAYPISEKNYDFDELQITLT